MIKKIIVGLTLLTCLSFTVTNHFRVLVLQKIGQYASNSYPEKIYVQTDKPYYALGDDIWFTAYLVNGITHKKSEKSNIIYVELINEQDSIISKKQLFTNTLSVAGDFNIRKNIKPGKYLLRAYTNYMRNGEENDLFQKEISIIDYNSNRIPLHLKEANPAQNLQGTRPNKPEINFYPEGGNLVNNLSSKIAIQVKNYNNTNLQGHIKDSENNIISSFKTSQYGIGITTLTPKENTSFYASIMINNEEFKYPLPDALPSGHTLSLVNSGDKITIKAASNHSIGLKNTFLVGHQRGKLVYEKYETTPTNEYIVTLNTELLLDGVTSFTLFDNNGNPVCERLVFIDTSKNDVNLQLDLSNNNPKTREKVAMQLSLKDKNGASLKGQISMSITDLDAIDQKTTDENIKTYLLLNSDIRGSIENPGYFFEKENDPRRRYELDLIMLTHGWRRFKWTDLLYEKSLKPKFSEEKGIYISGYTTALEGTKSRLASHTRMTFMGRIPYQENQKATSLGAFKYGPFVFNDSIKVLLEARVHDFKSEDLKNKKVSIYLDEPFYDSPKVVKEDVLKLILKDTTKISNFIKQAQTISTLDSIYLENATRLDEIVITAKKESEEAKRTAELNSRTNYGSATRRLDMANYKNQSHLTVFQLLRNIPGIITYGDSIYMRNKPVTRILVDDFPVDVLDVFNMTGDEVDFIDVLTGAQAASYSNVGVGVIAIYTKTGEFERNINIKNEPGIINFTTKGFYTAREYYAPNYEDDFTNLAKQDLRTTLHWEPTITFTDAPINTKEISFFTSDTRSKYGIRIEGITETGIPIYYVTTLDVD
ncbi:Plug domain-containing protein [Pseudotamlana carrageenivorans]|uniref:TonB-dependent receptor plug domain-containing protein n=1 Tax=Pseudotamlana carrageenivorans TaxID=2069432 RepID=A0A2I7SEG7_9FLAO|nr:Plug domain-containing protein [Tamlana carrageenivorans]AUS04299.1 hypothetical protein C1A40_01890 [Tamlana carrageenivorans]